MTNHLVRIPPLVAPGPPLRSDELVRYSRHVLLPQLGELGQRRLRNARVCVIGAGGLGAPVLQYLAAAGVGRLGIVDFDEVDESNLQRQVIHTEADVGRAKVESARDAVVARNTGTEVVVHPVRLTLENIESVLDGYDVVVDGTDNFPTRYLVADACERLQLPHVWGSIFRFDAQVTVFWADPPPQSGAPRVGLRDLFPQPPADGSVPSCAEGGVLGPMCGQVGSLMATEVVKLITGAGHPLLGRVAVLDALASRWHEIPLAGTSVQPPRAAPPRAARSVDSTDARGGAARNVGIRASEPRDSDVPLVGVATAEDLASRLAERAAGRDDFVLLDVREPSERAAMAIPGSILTPPARIVDGSALVDLDPQQPVVVYCHSGARSQQAGEIMLARGFAEVDNLEGGIIAWLRSPAGYVHE